MIDEARRQRAAFQRAAYHRTTSLLRPPASDKLLVDRRKCLGCGTMFRSSWIGHRICQPCKGRIERGNPLGDDAIPREDRRGEDQGEDQGEGN
jgi:hypothetical protein